MRWNAMEEEEEEKEEEEKEEEKEEEGEAEKGWCWMKKDCPALPYKKAQEIIIQQCISVFESLTRFST